VQFLISTESTDVSQLTVWPLYHFYGWENTTSCQNKIHGTENREMFQGRRKIL